MAKVLTLESVNARMASFPVSVKLRGKSLYLRATLPPKVGESLPKQREIPIAKHHAQGLKFAEEMALELAGDLLQWKRSGEFDWSRWSDGERQKPVAAAQQIGAFEDWYRKRRTIKDETWELHWLRYLALFPQSKPITEDVILRVLLSFAADSRDRKRCSQVIGKLCEFLGFSLDLSPYRGQYSPQSSDALDVPTAKEMLELVLRVPSRPWRNYLGLQATFGLRSHEPHYSKLEGQLCRVSEGKTGSRIAYPLYREWIERLELSEDMAMPKIGGTTYREISSRVSKGYKRNGFRLPPRTPRYCYVVDAVCVQNIPVPAVAQSLGHSATVLLSTYSRYISAATMAQAFGDRTQFASS